MTEHEIEREPAFDETPLISERIEDAVKLLAIIVVGAEAVVDVTAHAIINIPKRIGHMLLGGSHDK